MVKIKKTNEELKMIARQFDTKKGLEKGDRKTYRAICYRGREFIDECCGHMKVLTQRFTDEEIATVALKYWHRNLFCEGDNRYYQQASKRGILGDVCAHMNPIFQEWDEASIRAAALECVTRGEFSQKYSQPYKKAKSLGIYEEVVAHMVHKSPPRSNKTIIAEAKLCNFKKEFERRFPASYKAALVRGILDEVCCHMKLQHEVWTEERIGIIAKGFNTRKEFEYGNPLAYDASRRKKIKDIVCAHMVPGKSFEYDKPATLYFAEVDNGKAFKIGVTNNSFERRFRDEKTPINLLEQWHFKTGREAFDIEQYVLKEHKHLKYRGKPVLSGSGNTELFSQNILLIVRNAIR